MNELTSMSFNISKREKESIINDINVDMPLTFDSKQEYLLKLQEMLEKESLIDRLNVEIIAEKDVQFKFEERLEIYCRMRLRVPKTH